MSSSITLTTSQPNMPTNKPIKLSNTNFTQSIIGSNNHSSSPSVPSQPYANQPAGSINIGQFDLVQNTQQIIIAIPEDRLRLKLSDFKKANSSLFNWTTPLGLFIAITLTFVTTDFKSFLGIPKEYVSAFFVVADIAIGIWLIISSIKSIYNRVKKRNSIDTLINKIKTEH